ncbi:MAG TPA: hypothetical protein EYQ50_20040 [Verrucomicrobiales bacterium]|nr:hypothetical protein [Verrucomicrobiales bacterium]
MALKEVNLSIQTHFKKGRRGRLLLAKGCKKNKPEITQVSRIGKLMALAIKYENLLRRGVVQDYAGLARRLGVDRSLITRVMNLRLLAPDIQEQLVGVNKSAAGLDMIHLKEVIPITHVLHWDSQRIMWQKLQTRVHRVSED